MMSLVNVNNISVLNDNPAKFTDPMSFEIIFECLQELEDDLEWKILYVSPDCSSELILEEVLVGPVPIGINKFTLEADPPTSLTTGGEEVLGITVIFITCSYREFEFVRVGYYVHNILEGYDHLDEERRRQRYKRKNKRKSSSTKKFDISKVTRQILADRPRMTKFEISWDSNNTNKSHITNNSDDNNDNIKNTVDEQQYLTTKATERALAPTPQTIPDDEDDQTIMDEDDEETKKYFAVEQLEKQFSAEAAVVAGRKMVRMITIDNK